MTVLYQTKTPYHDIKVVEEGTVRRLVFGSGMCGDQSGLDILDPTRHVFNFSLLSMHSLLFRPNPNRILVIGLGGGIIPKEMACHVSKAKIDIIEIDPEVIKIAKEFFPFEENDKIRVHTGDAFSVIDKLTDKYDIVIVDAFNTNYIPYHLMCKEFHSKILRILKNGGVSTVNACNVHPSFMSQVRTLYDVFGEHIYHIEGLTNPYVTMLFLTNGKNKPQKKENSRYDFIVANPHKFRMTKEIMGSKIFTMNSGQTV